MKLHRFLAILTIVLVIILIGVVWFFPSNEDFRTENPFWNGTKDINSAIGALPLESLSDLPTASEGVTLLLIPYLSFTSAELNQLNQFITQGGVLVLADDYGYGNQILEYLELKARFSGQVLLDPLFNYKSKWFPRISHLAPDSTTTNIDSLVLNHATCLVDVDTDEVIALSSPFSFLDLNGNEAWDTGELTGPLPVISQYNLADGQIILISDPSIFINSMGTIESNYGFIQNIAGTSKFFIDQSHLPPSTLHQSKNLLAFIRSYLTTPLGTLILVILVLTMTLIPIWHKRREK